GGSLSTQVAWLAAARQLVHDGAAKVVALSLGHRGAALVTTDLALRARAPDVAATSAVGAGDRFLGGMGWGPAAGNSLDEAFRYGVAAGTAAVLNSGTELSHPADVKRLYAEVRLEHL